MADGEEVVLVATEDVVLVAGRDVVVVWTVVDEEIPYWYTLSPLDYTKRLVSIDNVPFKLTPPQ